MGKGNEFPPSILDLGIEYQNAEIGISFVRHYMRLRNPPLGTDDDAPILTDDFNYNKDVVVRDLWWPEIKAYRELPHEAAQFVSFCSAMTADAKRCKRRLSWLEIAEEQFRTICKAEGREVPLFLLYVDPKPEEHREMERRASRHAWWYTLCYSSEAEVANETT